MADDDCLIHAKPPWKQDVLLVCEKCEDKLGRGVDDERTALSKWLRKRLKKSGQKKALRVVSCACLDLCPKAGVAMMRGRDGASRKPLRVYRAGDDPQCVLDWLQDTAEEPG